MRICVDDTEDIQKELDRFPSCLYTAEDLKKCASNFVASLFGCGIPTAHMEGCWRTFGHGMFPFAGGGFGPVITLEIGKGGFVYLTGIIERELLAKNQIFLTDTVKDDIISKTMLRLV